MNELKNELREIKSNIQELRGEQAKRELILENLREQIRQDEKNLQELNQRPRKCLGYKTPQEVYFSTMLHLV